ncbi:MAG: hypothetical protein IMZ64_04665, partial [Bacteroidetes bacterium]|nr:hypothetical protein [Bacteroidota bacterium]
FDKKYFECGGKKFFVKDSLSIARFRESQKLYIEWGYSATFETIFNNLTKAIEAYNKHDYFDMSVILYKIQEGIKQIDTKDDPSLRLCALFIDEEGEDPIPYNEAVIQAKIDCWAEELDVAPFFYLAASLVTGWMPAYELNIRSGLEEKPEESRDQEAYKMKKEM